MLLEFSLVHDKPSSSMMIFDITLGPEPPSIRQQWAILSIIFTEMKNGGFFTGCLKLFTPILFTVGSSSFVSSKRLAMVEAFPSIKFLRCFCCSGMTTMSKRVASALILANWLRMLYLEEGRGEGTP
jgi:hypothetical protein